MRLRIQARSCYSTQKLLSLACIYLQARMYMQLRFHLSEATASAGPRCTREARDSRSGGGSGGAPLVARGQPTTCPPPMPPCEEADVAQLALATEEVPWVSQSAQHCSLQK